MVKIGDRVIIHNTLLYNGRTGVVVPNSGLYDDPWDFNVRLDDGRIIGVNRNQLRRGDKGNAS